eukprot:8764856-Alexandrium_andersonii.AAC.1
MAIAAALISTLRQADNLLALPPQAEGRALGMEAFWRSSVALISTPRQADHLLALPPRAEGRALGMEERRSGGTSNLPSYEHRQIVLHATAGPLQLRH